jgi:Family of unknown function (DUF6340)
VTISPEIKTVGIIDRSTPTDQTKSLDALDKWLSLEGADLDSIGTLEAIKGVTQELAVNDRFNEVKLLSGLKFKTTSLGGLPVPLTWEQVEDICRDNGTLDDAVAWAQKAYSDFRNKQGLRYVRILETRKYNEDVLRYQEQR